MKENMFYGASHLIFQKAEEVLWKHIHINEWKLKFRRQLRLLTMLLIFIVRELNL